jgi:Fe2+ or Zn2+ uptake regulation protein
VEHCGAEALQSAILRNSKYFMEIKQHSLEFYGVCKRCTKNHLAKPISRS